MLYLQCSQLPLDNEYEKVVQIKCTFSLAQQGHINQLLAAAESMCFLI